MIGNRTSIIHAGIELEARRYSTSECSAIAKRAGISFKSANVYIYEVGGWVSDNPNYVRRYGAMSGPRSKVDKGSEWADVSRTLLAAVLGGAEISRTTGPSETVWIVRLPK